jgi:hypothetical protein
MLVLLRTLTLLFLTSFMLTSAFGLSATKTALRRRAELEAGPLSNAARLARGLPLRAPRRLFSPTRALPSVSFLAASSSKKHAGVLRSTPSAVPGVT